MTSHRLARFAAAAVAASLFTLAHAASADKVELVCPDRSVRNADIALVASAANWRVSSDEMLMLREHARSACAAGLTVATLRAPRRQGDEGEQLAAADAAH